MSRRMRCPCIVREHLTTASGGASPQGEAFWCVASKQHFKSNSAGGNGGRLAPPFVIVSRGTNPPLPVADEGGCSANEATSFASESAAKRLCRIVRAQPPRGRGKFPKQVSCGRKFSFLSDFPPVSAANRKICNNPIKIADFYRQATPVYIACAILPSAVGFRQYPLR